MRIRTIACAAALVVMLLPTAGLAASITVLTDSGNLGSFTFQNTGVGPGGTATIAVSVPGVTAQINTVNGLAVPPEPATTNTPTTFLVTPAGANAYALTIPDGDVKTVGLTVGAQAKLGFNLTAGATSAALPAFFNTSGPVTALLANLDPLYDFSQFAAGHGTINITFTATSFTGTSNFAGLFTTVGATAVGNGSFSQVANVIPEPASAPLLGLGLAAVAAACWSSRRPHRP